MAVSRLILVEVGTPSIRVQGTVVISLARHAKRFRRWTLLAW